jgi:hypothetical protein
MTTQTAAAETSAAPPRQEHAEHQTQALTRFDPEEAAAALQHVLATGDLAQLTNTQRVAHYLALCESLGLNSLSRPFDWLMLDDRLVLYPNKSCAEQLRRRFQISVKIVRREPVGDMFVVEVEGRTPDGRIDQASKYVSVTGYNSKTGQTYRLTGDRLANAYAKAETGAKRRLTFSMIGLGMVPDLEQLDNVKYVVIDGHGNVIDQPTQEQRALAEDPGTAQVIGEPTFESTVDPANAPLTGASQAPTAEELEPVKRSVPRQSFRPDEEEVRRRVSAWFVIVKGTSLDTDDARHAYVMAWTANHKWPKAKQTGSVRTFFARATHDEAALFLNELRRVTDAEKQLIIREAEEQLAEAEAEAEAPLSPADEPF